LSALKPGDQAQIKNIKDYVIYTTDAVQRGLTLHGKEQYNSQTVTQNGQSSEKPYCRKGDDARNQQTVLITIVVMDDDTRKLTKNSAITASN
ncbi:hypothetical protein T05_15936, partial [Trichinella murrelli]